MNLVSVSIFVLMGGIVLKSILLSSTYRLIILPLKTQPSF
jgi:hypothetical protein